MFLLGMCSYTFAFDSVLSLENPNEGIENIEVITVTGERPLSFFRKQMREKENAFFALHNTLTDSDDFKIICAHKTVTGNNLAQRVCEPKYIGEIKYKETQFSLEQGSKRRGLEDKIQNLPTKGKFRIMYNKKRKEHLESIAELVKNNSELKQSLVALNLAKDALHRKKIEEFGDNLAGKHTMTTAIEDQ